MQGIEFDEEQNTGGFTMKTTQPRPEEKQSALVKLLMNIGIEDKSTANLVLLGIAAIFFGITFFIYAGILGNNAPSPQNVEQIAAQMRALREMQGIK